MSKDGTLSEIDKSKFLEIVGGEMDSVAAKNKNSFEHKIAGKNEDKIKILTKSIALKDLILIKKLGAG